MSDSPAIRGTTRLLGLLGYPVGHSLSPAMHNAALARLGLDLIYVPLPVAPADLSQAVAGLRRAGFVGFNVTIPHKQAIVPLLDTLTPEAKGAGAVNTVRIETDGSLTGTNTDIEGFIGPIKTLPFQGAATILGCGGSALAVALGCAQLGFTRIHVVGRDLAKLAAFKSHLHPATTVEIYLWEQLESLLPGTGLLINTTPVGMVPATEASPLEDLGGLPPKACVYDLIYRPRPTRLLQLAAARSLQTFDGLGMLVAQAEGAFHFWTGCKPPADLMQIAAEKTLAMD
ncbi:shikimate dehydrogenase [Gloeobacter morelensis MG652769]|uniref:Shikimate dehydrogenase (NADP(+)) n=2 Tax=Gloeobacter TaxID=33071 RepID=A0ABY3PUE2_9CYAN|nr:shikimate dehydrogenase [Gloeobacter morelensis MG652769]